MTYDPELRRDTPLALKLREDIRDNGPISVADYMSRCLWDDAHGYYATQEHVIGAAGDFITSADISQIFGEIIGLWSAIVWQEVMGSPSRVTLTEYGPGRGTMMRDALRAARVVPGFRAAASAHLVEMSPVLAALQRATLGQSPFTITWGHNLVGFAPPAIIVANEFVDAWPVSQWVRSDGRWKARGVGLNAAGGLSFCLLDDTPEHAPPAWLSPHNASDGTIVESHRIELLAQAFKSLSEAGPIAVLLIDYGYTSPFEGDTLQAVRGHAYESPLTSPGEADLSAHVNFFELATALHTSGLSLDGPVTQAEFLGALGAVERASRLMAANRDRAAEIESGVARLLAPNGMGTRFKVLGVRSSNLGPLPGFAVAGS